MIFSYEGEEKCKEFNKAYRNFHSIYGSASSQYRCENRADEFFKEQCIYFAIRSGVPLVTKEMDCEDFSSQQAAQEFHRFSNRGDMHNLDNDNDGVACEDLQH